MPPPNYWDLATRILATYGRMPDGKPLSQNIVNALMVGVWFGARMALYDHEAAVTLASIGNELVDDVRYKSLRDGLDTELTEGIVHLIQGLALHKGFSHLQVGAVHFNESALGDEDAQKAVEEALRLFGGGNNA